ncbi:unnamed protein product [Closterium sp. Yama58-4]|nr:unnamed protein product [Closterium sp. Yama58-4]
MARARMCGLLLTLTLSAALLASCPHSAVAQETPSPAFKFSNYMLKNCLAQTDSSTNSVRSADFGDGFAFGVTTSATQVEGSTSKDGRGPSIWDAYSMLTGAIADGSKPSDATQSYDRYKTDVKFLKEMGVKNYRFSISWPRVVPAGVGALNAEGVRFYNDFINELKDNGIEPVVTLYHWDLPFPLERDQGGWLNDTIVRSYANYAETCFRKFGDRVKTWITFAEPQQIAVQGYGTGGMAPGRCSDRTICTAGNSSSEPYIVAHNILKAHALAVQIYRQKYKKQQGGRIGIALDCVYHYAADETRASKNAAQRGMEFAYGWFADPIRYGSYPRSMRYFVGDRMPKFNRKEARRMRGATDFLGLDFYSAVYAWPGSTAGAGIPWTDARVSTSPRNPRTGKFVGEPTSSKWLYVAPESMKNMLLWIKNRYGKDAAVIVTENGVSEHNVQGITMDKALCDVQRVNFHKSYLQNVLDAKNDGVNVQGYFAWSMMDNWEWSQGYTQRFGMLYVNFTHPLKPRYPKASAIWFKNFLATS